MKDTYWEKLGEDGSEYQMGPQAHRIELLEIMQQYPISTILDVGCGTGPLCELNNQIEDPFIYFGCDYSENFIETCKKRFKKEQFSVQDARNMTYESNSFDALIIMHCLDHVDDHISALKEAYRVCKKYTFIVLWRPFVDKDTHDLNSSGYIDNKNYEDTHLQDFGKVNLDKEIQSVGFKILDEKQIGEPKGKYNYLYVLEKN